MDEERLDRVLAGGRMPFAVPEGYFERFAEGLDVCAVPRRRPVWMLVRPIVTAAAVFAGLIAVSYFVLTLRRGLGAGDEYMPVRQEYAEIIADQFKEFQLEDILADADD